MGSVFSFRECFSASNCVTDSVKGGHGHGCDGDANDNKMSRKSSRLPSMVDRLTSVMDLAIALKGSSCWLSNSVYTPAINVLVLKMVIKLNGIHTCMYVEVAV